MSAPPVVVGVDGGGTSLRVLVVDAAGRPTARTEAASPLAKPGATAASIAAAVAALVADACAPSGGSAPIAALWAGIAGAGREPRRSELADALGHALPGIRIAVGTDVEAAFADAFGTGPGVLLLAGTGSIAWGRAADGREARAGGWGPLLGDEGSGAEIGRSALRRVARAADGRAPATALTRAVLGHLRLDRPEDLVAWAAAAGRGAVAGLAPVVYDTAERGDAVAAEVLADAVRALDAHLPPLLTTLGPWGTPPTVALAGGLLTGAGGPLRAGVLAAVRARGLPVLERPVDAARGAARNASRLAADPGGPR